METSAYIIEVTPFEACWLQWTNTTFTLNAKILHLQFVSHFFKVSLQLDGWLAFEDKLVSTKLWLTTEIWNQSSSKEIFFMYLSLSDIQHWVHPIIVSNVLFTYPECKFLPNEQSIF